MQRLKQIVQIALFWSLIVSTVWTQNDVYGDVINNVAFVDYSDGSQTPFTGVSNPVVTEVIGLYNLEISKAVDTALVAPGSIVNYSLTIANLATYPAPDVTVLDTLPAYLIPQTTTPQATVNGQVVSWLLTSIPGSDVVTMTISALVSTEVPWNTTLDNTAWISAPNGYSTPSNTVQISTADEPVLTISKIVDKSVAFQSDTLVYTIAASYNGYFASENTIMRDVLPPFSQFYSNTGTATLAAGELIWNLGTLASGSEISETVKVVLNGTIPANTELWNEGNIINVLNLADTSRVMTMVNPTGVAFAIIVDATPTHIPGDGIATSLITATVTDVAGDPVPDGTEVTLSTDLGFFVSQTSVVRTTLDGQVVDTLRAEYPNSPNVNPETAGQWPTATVTGQTLALNNVMISDDAPVVFYPASIQGWIMDHGTSELVSGGTSTVKNSQNELIWTSATNTQGKYDNPIPGDDTYTVTNAFHDAFGRSVSTVNSIPVTIPESGYLGPITNFSSITGTLLISGQPITTAGHSVYLTNTTTGQVIDSTLTSVRGKYAFNNLSAGNYTVYGVYQTANSLRVGSEAVPSLQPGYWEMNVNVDLNTVQVPFTKTSSSPNYISGDTAEFNITLSNPSNIALTNVVVTDPLPTELTFDHASGTGQLQGNSVVWNLGTVPAQTDVTLQVWAQTPSGLFEDVQVTNIAYLVADGLPELNAQAMITISSAPALDLTISAPIQAIRGQSLTYDFNYTNTGQGTATAVVLCDTLAWDIDFTSAVGDYNYDDVSRVLTWNLGDLASDQSGSVQATVLLRGDILSGTTVYNGGTIRSSEGIEASAIWATVIRGPELTLEVVTDSAVVHAGDLFTYHLQFCNVGDTIATNTVLSDTLDSRLTYVSSTDGGIYDPVSHSVLWNLGNLEICTPEQAPSAKSLIALTSGALKSAVRRDASQNWVEITVRLPSPMENGITLFNQGEITCGEGVAASVAVDAITVMVESAPVLSLEKLGDVEVMPGELIHYALAYNNIGNMIARNVVLTDSLSDLETFVSASGNYAYNATSRRITWEVGDLSPLSIPDSVYVTARAQIELPNGAQIFNNAYASADGDLFTAAQYVTTNILPLRLNLTAIPNRILGNGLDSSFVVAQVLSFLGNPAPDGIPVAFTATMGTINTEFDTIPTFNGIAQTHLHSSIVSNQAIQSLVHADAHYGSDGIAEDTTTVTFLIGAFEGTIVDYNTTPVDGAVVSLILLADNSVVGVDTTGVDGYYLIAVDHTDQYQVVFTIYDSEGNPTVTDQPVTIEVPENGTITRNLNSISGILMDGNTGLVLPEGHVAVILNGNVDSTMYLSKATSNSFIFCDTTYTDDNGFYFFTNLMPGDYVLTTDYQGNSEFSNGSLALSINTMGTYVVNANVPLVQSQFMAYKRVDKAEAQIGDTLTYRVYYQSVLSALPDSVSIWISDPLPPEVEYLPATARMTTGATFVSFDSTNNAVMFKRNGIPQLTLDSLIFQARVRTDLHAGMSVFENVAKVYNANDTASTDNDSRSRAVTRVVVPYLLIQKNVNRRVAQLGDILTYKILLQNRSSLPTDTLNELYLTDILPLGFKYKSNSSYCESEPLSDPLVIESERGQMKMIWQLPETLPPGGSCDITYRAIVSMNAHFGENDNLAYATAFIANGDSTQTSTAKATVVVKPGFLSDVGFIFGKIFYDLNQNGEHDLGEPTAGNVELISETGIHVVTDEFGKYSIPNVRAGRHVLRVNRKSLPDRTHVLLNSADYFGDAISRSVDVSPGGMAKANFALEQEVDVSMTITEISTLQMTQQPLTEDFRQIVYKPWRTTFRLGFLSGEAKLRPELFSALRKASDFLRWQKEVIIEIDGHTNNIPIGPGTAYTDNFELSKARAEAIKQFLVDEMGIDAKRITTHGYGPTRPIASNDEQDGRDMNRRVEMVFHTPEENLPYDQELRFQVNMVKKGGAKLSNVMFHEILPSGFTYKPNTASFEGKSIEPISVTETEAIWLLGQWVDEDNRHTFEFAVKPLDHTRIPTISSSKGYLVFDNAMGQSDTTGNLQSNLITHVEETLLRINLQEGNFDLNSAKLRNESFLELNKLGSFMMWQQDFTITIKGFTDNTGSFDYNMRLSRNRAESVKNYLAENFPIDPERIETSFYGPLYPIASNDSPQGRAQNRRVELLVNSDFQQEFIVHVEGSSDSLAYRVNTESAMTDSGMVTRSIELKPGVPEPYRINLALTDYSDVDSVRVSVQLPSNLAILEEAPTMAQGLLTWTFPVGAKPTGFSREFQLQLNADETTGDSTAKFKILPIMKSSYNGKPFEQTLVVKKKKN